MSKRHFVITPDRGFRCVQCRVEFSTREEFTKHCGWGGKCKHPLTLGLTIDIAISPNRWTSKGTIQRIANFLGVV